MGLLDGRTALIFGVANDHSIAWGIAQALHAEGAEVGFSSVESLIEKRVRPLATSIGSTFVEPCDVGSDEQIARVFARWGETHDSLDILVHALAFARRALPLMTEGGSLITLTYEGATRVMPSYNVMGVAKAALEASVRYLAVDLGGKGIRVNAISAGPIKTLAASGIGDFRYILRWNEYNSPLKRTVTPEEVGDSGLYFLSDMSRGVTGEIHHVDSGYHVVGMKAVDAPDISTVKD